MDRISWKAREKIHTEKTADWYWIVGIVTISFAIVSIILNNIIFAVLILVSSFTLTLIASRRPHLLDAEIDNEGVLIGKTFYPYANLDSFWVETRDAHPRLILKSKKVLMTLIAVLLEDTDPKDVRSLIIQHLREEEHIEPLFEKVLIYLGF